MKAFISLFFLAACIFASPIDTMSPGTWYTAPNSAMRPVAPVYGQFAGTWACCGPGSVFTAWGGGVYDTQRDRLVVWGGGHGDYYGNEIYVFDITTMKWTRLTDPTVNPTLPGPNWDGTPSSRHTYNQIAYVEHADVMFNMGGGTCGCGTPAQFTEGTTWAFDFAQKKWINCNPSTDGPGAVYAMNCAYDPASKKVWYGHENNGFWDYNYDLKKWTKHNSDNGFYYYTSVIDTKRGLFVEVGSGNVYAYDIGHNNFTRQVWTTTGGSAFISKSNVGLAYDSVADKIVGWAGGAVYVLDPATKVWTSYNPSGAPTATSNGIFGRWRYVPSHNVFVVATGIDDNVHFFKLPAGAGTAVEKKSVTSRETIQISPNPVTGGRAVVGVTDRSPLPRAAIYDLQGRQVATVADGVFNTTRMSNGVYLLKAIVGGKILSKRLLIQQ